MFSTTFAQFYQKYLNEDVTCDTALGANIQLYSTLAEPTSDTYAPGDARRAKILGKNKRVMRRNFPDTVFLDGKTRKSKKRVAKGISSK